MNSLCITALAAASVLAVTAYFIARSHFRERSVSREKDFFTAYAEKVELEIETTGVNFQPKWYYALMGICPFAIGFFVFYMTSNAPGSIVCGVFGLFVPAGILKVMERVREAGFEKYFLRSLEQLDSSLRSGSSIAQAVDDVANCAYINEPLRRKYAKLSADIHMGISVPEAFRSFAASTKNADAADMALALELQDQVGGHEADAVRNISNNIKSRISTRKEINSLFAGEASLIWIADFLIPGMMIVFIILNPSYAEAYFSSLWNIMLFIGMFGLCGIGSAVNHRNLKKVQQP